MKKTTVLITLLALVFGSFAQKDFQLGLSFSPNVGWLNPTGNNVESDGSKIGYTFGIIGDFNITENYIFSTGIQLMSAGVSVIKPDKQTIEGNVLPENFGKTTADIRLNYIDVPLTLKLRTNEIGYMKYYGQVGFGLGVNYKAEANEEFAYSTSTSAGATLSNDDVDYDSEINLFRAALVVGAGLEYNLSGNTSLIAGITFNNGFTNIFSNDVYKADSNGNAISNTALNSENKRTESAKSVNNLIILNIGLLF